MKLLSLLLFSLSAFAAEQIIVCHECGQMFTINSPVLVVHPTHGEQHSFVPWEAAPIVTNALTQNLMLTNDTLKGIVLTNDGIYFWRWPTNWIRTNDLVYTNIGSEWWYSHRAYRKPKGPHQFPKECPECGMMCVSTNATSWIVNDNDGHPDARIIQVSFNCPNPDCESQFSDTIRKPLRKTPITELPDVQR